MAKRAIRSSMCTSSAAIISGVTSVLPATSLDRLEGSVATSAISTYRSRSRPVSSSSNSDPGSASARANAHRLLSLVHGPVHLHDVAFLANPTAEEQPGGPVIARLRVDLQHWFITDPMLNDAVRARLHADASDRPRSHGPRPAGLRAARHLPGSLVLI